MIVCECGEGRVNNTGPGSLLRICPECAHRRKLEHIRKSNKYVSKKTHPYAGDDVKTGRICLLNAKTPEELIKTANQYIRDWNITL